MLRYLLLKLSHALWAKRLFTQGSLGWKVASRFVAGETLESALLAVEKLNKQGAFVTLDHLGENTTTPAEAHLSVEEIVQALHALEERSLSASVSVKLSQLGLGLGQELCSANVEKLVTAAKRSGHFVRLDMEDSSTVEETLRLYRWLRGERGLDNVGVVIQSYLYRSAEDIRLLAAEGASVRLVKGAYAEPPQLAFRRKDEVNNNFDRLLDLLLEKLKEDPELPPAQGTTPARVAVATHDEDRIDYARDALQRYNLPRDRIEFQMLYGIRRSLQRSLLQQGYPLRVYVPYGTQWYPYFMRRLAERPANLWFFFQAFFRG